MNVSSFIRVRILTLNVNGQTPPEDGIDKLFTSNEQGLDYADFIAVGLQEVSFHIKNYIADSTYRQEPWSNAVRNYLFANNFVQISCGWISKPRSLGLSLLIFIKRPLVTSVRRVETRIIRTGLAGISGNKGAVCVRITRRDGTRLTFINCHLSPGVAYATTRIKEYHTILSSLKFDLCNIVSDGYIFWFGDLNSRTENLVFEDVIRAVRQDNIQKLLDYDQLNRCRYNSRAFADFSEGEIAFKPTYKLLNGSLNYDTKRIPSYCDRILYKAEGHIGGSDEQLNFQLLYYNSIPSSLCSDHLPVAAAFYLKVFDYLPMTEVQFFTQSSEISWYTSQNNMCRYKVSSSYYPSSLDWIGVFKVDFVCDDEPLTWVYTISCWEDEQNDGYSIQNITFKRWYIPPIGNYLFGYYSRDRSCLIGLSEPFEICSPEITLAEEVIAES